MQTVVVRSVEKTNSCGGFLWSNKIMLSICMVLGVEVFTEKDKSSGFFKEVCNKKKCLY